MKMFKLYLERNNFVCVRKIKNKKIIHDKNVVTPLKK